MQTPTRIAVAGATGRVGRHVVDALREQGYDVVPIARSTGVDVVTGQGLPKALEGVDSLIDAATGPSPDEAEATAFFMAATRNLQEAGRRAGVRGIVLVSIIGIDRFAGGYAAAKAAQERAMLAGPIPVTILRAAQFHEFVGQIVDWGRQGDVSYVPEMRTQLVAARTVAEALADLATGGADAPADGLPIPEIAGPREESLVEAARKLAARSGNGLRIERGDWGEPDGDLYRNGAALPSPHAKLAGPTFEEWLDAAGERPVSGRGLERGEAA